MNQSTPIDFDPFREGDLEALVPTSPQEEVWVAVKMGGTDANLCFNECLEVTFRGPLDPDVLERCLREVVSRHESLRSNFLEDGTRFTIQPQAELALERVDLTGLDRAAQEAELTRRLEHEVTVPFDLERGPMIRAQLLSLGPDEQRLILDSHHIACDGGSAGILLREMGELFSAWAAGGQSPLVPPPTFSAYAKGQRARETNPEGRADLAFWLEHLRGHQEDVALPTDRPRPSQRSYCSQRYDHVIDPDLVRRIRTYAGRARCTFQVVMSSAIKTLLFRLTRQTDLVLGIPSAGQVAANEPSLVGHCVHLLPVRSQLDPQAPFADYLQHVRAQFTDAVEHSQVTFSSILAQLDRPLDPSRVPLVPVTFNLDHGVKGLRYERLKVNYEITPRIRETFELAINAPLHGDSLILQCAHNTDLFDQVTIANWMRCLERILEQVVESEGRIPIAALELLGPEDRMTALAEAWGPRRELDPHRPVQARIAELAATQPDAPAVIAGDERISYEALDQAANRLGRWLGAQGVARGDRVGVCMQRCPDLLSVLLGVWRAGAAYVPLDPHLPPARLLQLVEDAGATLILTEADLIDHLPTDARTCVLDDLTSELSALDASPLVPDVAPEDPAYVLFTSGSTGRPKGVVIPQVALENFLTSMQEQPGFSAKDRILAVTTISFDIAGLELFLPLISGGSLVLATRNDTLDPAALDRLMQEHEVTMLQATPATWRMLLDWGWGGRRQLKVLCGGEPFPLELAEPLLKSCGEVWNLYGPTETTIWSTVKRLKLGEPITIGLPLQNTSAYVLDEGMNLLPPGVPGELWLGGLGVALGYLGRPDLTTERFVKSPFQEEDRLYRTGDLVVQSHDGELHCLGRLDLQVKIRGFRIELGDIEAALADFPGVRAGVVDTHMAGSGDLRLVAYVVPEGPAPKSAEVRAWLQERLPSYAVPGLVISLDALPLSPAGKVDRRQLPAPNPALLAEGTDEETSESARPSSPMEVCVAELWADLLGRERVGRHDDFFALGGHSLLAIRAASHLQSKLATEVSVGLMFQHPTLAELAQALEELTGTASTREEAASVAPDEACPLSPLQELFWIYARNNPGSSAYTVPTLLRLEGELNVPALRQAAQALVQHSDALRVRIELGQGGDPVQVLRDVDLALPLEDFSALPDSEKCVQDRVRELIDQPFSLLEDALVRGWILCLAPQTHLLLLTFDHIIFDGWSRERLIQHLQNSYAAISAGRSIQLPVTASFRDCMLEQRQRLYSERRDELLSYWRETLHHAPTAVSPRPDRLTTPDRPTGSADFELRPELFEGLSAECRRRRVTPFMYLLAAFDLLLHRWTGARDFTVGAPVVVRDHRSEGVLGSFVNSMVLRARLDGDLSFGDLLHQVREVVCGALAHTDLPFHELVAELNPARAQERNPFFEVFFNYLGHMPPATGFPGLTVEHVELPDTQHKFDMTLYVSERGEHADRLCFQLVYDAKRYEPGTMQAFLDQLEWIIEQSLSHTDQALDSFSLVTPAMRARLPALSCQPQSTQGAAIQEAFLEQARTAPDRVAIRAPGSVWTYGELAAHAQGIAQGLQSQGLPVGELVAVHASRSPALAATLLGILQAGGAFAILDPRQPAARLERSLSVLRAEGWVEMTEAGKPPASLNSLSRRISRRLRVEATPSPSQHPFQHPFSPTQPDPDRLAYVALTSGSTGQPKVIEGTHAPVVRFISWYREHLGLSENDRFAFLSGLGHDPLLRDLFTPLSMGATVCCPEEAALMDPDRLLEFLATEQVTVAHVTPALIRLLQLAHRPQRLDALRWVASGGDILRGEEVAVLRRLAPQAKILNLYGATETPQAVGCFQVEGEFEPQARVPIGTGVDQAQLLVLTQPGQLAGVGEEGEICVRSPYLARGYRTATKDEHARFVLAPGASEPTDRMYRTGDRGRYRADGTLNFLGRNDRQVQVRGYRVELGEIESVLENHEQVTRALVVARDPDQDGLDLRLDAYVTAHKPADETLPEALSQHLRRQLPAFMQPAGLEVLSSFPLTPNNKVDIEALPRASTSAAARPRNVRFEPRTQTEATIADLWEELLQLDRPVDVDDNFFDLGGHSLLAVRMMDALGEKLGATFPLELLMRTPTLGSLAEAIHGQGECVEESLVVEIQAGDGMTPFWVVHPIGGHVVFARRLAELLPPAQPLFGLQARGLDGRQPPLDSVQEMASHYIDLIRSVQPEGPYYLGGPSFGGVVCWEIAQQLHAAGEEVALLVLFDTFGPNFPTRQALPIRLYEHLVKVMSLPGKERSLYLRRRIPFLKKPKSWDEKLLGRREPSSALLEAVRTVIQTNARARSSYTIQPYAGSVTVFQATHRPHWPGTSFRDPKNGWGPYAGGGVNVVPIDSSHQNMFNEPYIEELGKLLAEVLCEAQAGKTS